MFGRGVSISYLGVHTAYQVAMAASEIGVLQRFYTSAVDATGAKAASLRGWIDEELLEGRQAPGLPLSRVTEYPWPLLAKSQRDRFYRRGANHWLAINGWFDRWAARQIVRDPPKVLVSVSSCGLHSMRAARQEGAVLVLDVPHVHPGIEAELLQEARSRAGLPPQPSRLRWRKDMNDRKLAELELADRIFTYSDFHRDGFVKAGIPRARMAVTPLWADTSLWYRELPYDADARRPLRLLYVGSISLRKGIPFLLKAVERCGRAVELTIVGPMDAESHHLLAGTQVGVRVLPAQSKEQLRRTYQAHDVLVLPSVCDSFGFVALEAMACGLPAIVSDNCGAPVPSPDWRVPAMNDEALSERIMHYADDRSRAATDGILAQTHASRFTAGAYRSNVATELGALLAV